MNKAQALNKFWNLFSSINGEWKAYDASSVPENISDKHITYETTIDSFGYPVGLTTSLWDKSSSWADIQQKEMEIAEYIGRGGIMVRNDNGAMWIKKANPWAQRLSDTENIKRIILNVEIEFLD